MVLYVWTEYKIWERFFAGIPQRRTTLELANAVTMTIANRLCVA